MRGVDNLLSHRACVQKRHRRSVNAERQLDDLPEGETQLLGAWPVSVLLQRDPGFQLRRVQGIGLCYVHHARVSAATDVCHIKVINVNKCNEILEMMK